MSFSKRAVENRMFRGVNRGKSALNIKFNGDIELQRLFKELDVSPSKIRQASMAAGNMIRTRARKKLKATQKTGNLMRSIIVKPGRNKKYASVWVGPNYGRFATDRGPHAHLVAFKFMRSTGRTSTNHPLGQFIQEAAGELEAKVMASVTNKYKKILEKEISKLLR